MILNSHICKSCRLCVKQVEGEDAYPSVQYWCTRRDNINMVGAEKWMPVSYLFGCRFWVKKAPGEYQRVIDVDGKRIGKAANNSRAIQFAIRGVARILDLRTGKADSFEADHDVTRRAIKTMIEKNKEKKKWTSREIVQWFLDNGEPVTLPEWYLSRYRIKNTTQGKVTCP